MNSHAVKNNINGSNATHYPPLDSQATRNEAKKSLSPNSKPRRPLQAESTLFEAGKPSDHTTPTGETSTLYHTPPINEHKDYTFFGYSFNFLIKIYGTELYFNGPVFSQVNPSENSPSQRYLLQGYVSPVPCFFIEGQFLCKEPILILPEYFVTELPRPPEFIQHSDSQPSGYFHVVQTQEPPQDDETNLARNTQWNKPIPKVVSTTIQPSDKLKPEPEAKASSYFFPHQPLNKGDQSSMPEATLAKPTPKPQLTHHLNKGGPKVTAYPLSEFATKACAYLSGKFTFIQEDEHKNIHGSLSTANNAQPLSITIFHPANNNHKEGVVITKYKDKQVPVTRWEFNYYHAELQLFVTGKVDIDRFKPNHGKLVNANNEIIFEGTYAYIKEYLNKCLDSLPNNTKPNHNICIDRVIAKYLQQETEDNLEVAKQTLQNLSSNQPNVKPKNAQTQLQEITHRQIKYYEELIKQLKQSLISQEKLLYLLQTFENRPKHSICLVEGIAYCWPQFEENIKTEQTGPILNGQLNGNNCIYTMLIKHPQQANSYQMIRQLEGSFQQGKITAGEYQVYNLQTGEKSIYTGKFKNAKLHGPGKVLVYDQHGIIHKALEGDFKSNQLTGRGKVIIYDAQGNVQEIQEGQFQNDLLNGHGSISWYKDKQLIHHQEGEFHNGISVVQPIQAMQASSNSNNMLTSPKSSVAKQMLISPYQLSKNAQSVFAQLHGKFEFNAIDSARNVTGVLTIETTHQKQLVKILCPANNNAKEGILVGQFNDQGELIQGWVFDYYLSKLQLFVTGPIDLKDYLPVYGKFTNGDNKVLFEGSYAYLKEYLVKSYHDFPEEAKYISINHEVALVLLAAETQQLKASMATSNTSPSTDEFYTSVISQLKTNQLTKDTLEYHMNKYTTSSKNNVFCVLNGSTNKLPLTFEAADTRVEVSAKYINGLIHSPEAKLVQYRKQANDPTKPYELVLEMEGTFLYSQLCEGKISQYDPESRTKVTWQGKFNDNKLSGEGQKTIFAPDGSCNYICEGNFVAPDLTDDPTLNPQLAVLTGQGKITKFYRNGKISEEVSGEFYNDKLNGAGEVITYYENGTISHIFKGEFSRHQLNGKGTVILFDETGKLSQINEGKYVNDSLNGEGKVTLYGKGNKIEQEYHGHFVQDKLNGEGEIDFYEDGNLVKIYRSNFTDNEPNSKGEFFLPGK